MNAIIKKKSLVLLLYRKEQSYSIVGSNNKLQNKQQT